MIKKRPHDINFNSDFGISVVVGILIFLATFALGTGVELKKFFSFWYAGTVNVMSVQIPAPKSEDEEIKVLDTALNLLNHIEGVKKAQVITRKEIESVSGMSDSKLQLPLFIDVEIDANNKDLKPSDIELQLLQHIEGVKVEAPIAPNEPYLEILSTLEYFLISVALVIFGSIFVVLVINTHLEIGAHTKTIQILSLLGASNSFIAKRFQKYVSSYSVKSLMIHSILTIFVFALLFFLGMGQNVLFEVISLSQLFLLFLGLPLAMVCMIFVVTTITVLLNVRRLFKLAQVS